MARKKTTRKRKTTARKATRKTARRKTTTKRAKTRRSTTKRASTRRSTTKRKTTAKKRKTSTARRAKSNSSRRKSLETAAIRDTFNKSQIMTYLADNSELTKKQVSEIFETLGNLMHRHLKKGAAGEFTIPGLMKCKVKRKPATKARKGINPFTGEPTTFKAKPARNVVKVRPLKKLKEMVE